MESQTREALEDLLAVKAASEATPERVVRWQGAARDLLRQAKSPEEQGAGSHSSKASGSSDH